MPLSYYERRALGLLPVPLRRHESLVNALVARLRGFGTKGRGLDSGGRGLNAGTLIEVIDDFESASTANYTLINGSDNTRFDTPAYKGSYGWRTDGPHPTAVNTEWASQPGDGLSAYPEPGDRILVWGRAITSGGSVSLMFPANSHSDTYRASFSPSQLIVSNQATGTSSSTSINASQDTWYELVVDWHTDGSYDALIRDQSGESLGSDRINETTFADDGGIGFRWGPDGEQNTFDLPRVQKGYNR
jgi:hypothetical protein